MAVEWRTYQQQAANFFRKLGFTAQVEHEVEGARGVHKVDAYIEGAIHGIPFKWIVECKAWNSNIPKEKVMALAAIVQDIGADKGFLLSETGFQSGAVRAANKTNISLSSLEDLAIAAKDEFVDAVIGGLNWRLHKAQIRLRAIKKKEFDDEYFPPMTSILGELFILQFVLEDALKNEYPFVYQHDRKVNSLDELLMIANGIITKAEQWSPPHHR